MKNFEEHLTTMEIPLVENDRHLNILKNKLEAHYFNPIRRVQLQLRWALGFAVFFFAIAFGLIVKPQIALQAHNVTFRGNNNVSFVSETSAKNPDCLEYTSIRNPKLRGEIDPDQYQEDKAYVIRKYRSHENNDAVLIVSEFEAQPTQLAYNKLF